MHTYSREYSEAYDTLEKSEAAWRRLVQQRSDLIAKSGKAPSQLDDAIKALMQTIADGEADIIRKRLNAVVEHLPTDTLQALRDALVIPGLPRSHRDLLLHHAEQTAALAQWTKQIVQATARGAMALDGGHA